MRLPKVYQANKYEKDIYKLWEDSGAFQPNGSGKHPFSIVMPPPNATGRLHVGHAAMLAIEDTLVRYHRMHGHDVLWVPGTDHAAIATNAIMEQRLAKEGKSKHDLGRDKFLDELHEFVEGSKDDIRSQIRAMGSSCDWTRERYTMEPAMNRIVGDVFIKMHDDGLIYRGHRIVNWDSNLQTVVSDDEVEYQEQKSTFFTLKYGPFEIGTARPETKFGDKYVVMHPDDKRYKDYEHGQEIDVDWINGNITATIIKDEAVDPEFGTGVMTITPWHDVTDFEIAERHKLDKTQIIDLEGNLLPIAEEFAGMNIEDARPKIVAKLKKQGLLVKEDDEYVNSVAISDRGKAIVEPQIMEQWFIDVNAKKVKWKGRKHSLKEVMQMVIHDSDIDILPKRFEKTYFHWIDNLRDWCISRQIWWGHRIPAWYRPLEEGGHEVVVGYEQPDGDGWHQDPDTLDTWFSSALWSWSTLIDPEVALDPKNDLHKMLTHSPDYKHYHPTTLMETGYDILFFWVARMILMTTYVTGEIPFKTVYLHGLVRTKDGSKMSKSKPESIIDPLDMIDQFGTDALRLSLLVGQAPGNDMRIFEEKIASYRNFCNKLWNIARFIEDKVGDDFSYAKVEVNSPADNWIMTRLHDTITEVDELMESYELGKAYEKIYHFIWDDFADWYIEISKLEFNTTMLVYVLENILKMAHPYAPFVTETIWDTLKWEKSLLINSEWPKVNKGDSKKADEFEEIRKIVREVRNMQTHLGLSNNSLYHKGDKFLEEHKNLIINLTNLKDVVVVESGRGINLTQTSHGAWIDVEEQKAQEYLMKLLKQRTALEKTLESLESRMKNKKYVSSAPKHLVEETKQAIAKEKDMLQKINKEVDVFESAMNKK